MQQSQGAKSLKFVELYMSTGLIETGCLIEDNGKTATVRLDRVSRPNLIFENIPRLDIFPSTPAGGKDYRPIVWRPKR